MIGIGLTAVFALAALTAANASAAPAAPQFKVCQKAAKTNGKYTGTYLDKACSKPASEAEIKEGKKNKYEAVEAPGQEQTEYTGKSKTATVLHATSEAGKAETITCKKAALTGWIASPEVFGHIKMKFEDCVNEKHEDCGTSGTIENERNLLYLVFTNSAETEYGVWLGEPESTTLFGASFPCGTEKFALIDENLATVTANGKALTITYTVNSSGEQQPREFYTEGKLNNEVEIMRADRQEATLTGTYEIKIPGIVIVP